MFLAALGLHCCAGFSLVAVGWLLVAEHCVQRVWASGVAAPRLWRTGSVVVVHGLSCSVACGILLGQGLYLCLLHWQTDFSSLATGEALIAVF